MAHLLARLPGIGVSADHVAYSEIRPDKAKSKEWIEPAELNTGRRQHVWEQVMHEHPVLMHHVRTGDTRPAKISDFLTRTRYHRTALYNELYRDMEVEDHFGFAFPGRGRVVIGIALFKNGPFSERDRSLLTVVAPHLMQACRNAQTATAAQRELALLKDGEEILDRGIVILSPHRRVRLATGPALRWLADYFGRRAAGGRLPEMLDRWVRRQQRLMGSVEGLSRPAKPLRVGHAGKQLLVRLLPHGDHGFLVLEERRAVAPGSTQKLGLTIRELEVLAYVARGKTNVDIGALLGISDRTVEKHLEHIYVKLGVETRTAAAARAFEAGVGDHGSG